MGYEGLSASMLEVSSYFVGNRFQNWPIYRSVREGISYSDQGVFRMEPFPLVTRGCYWLDKLQPVHEKLRVDG